MYSCTRMLVFSRCRSRTFSSNLEDVDDASCLPQTFRIFENGLFFFLDEINMCIYFVLIRRLAYEVTSVIWKGNLQVIAVEAFVVKA